ncbi:hypothetical protein RZS08_56930, partial [Arthrospira platensis SPKY1]|nr:hypothetical protein [Arthrospira platensis SPKY1]
EHLAAADGQAAVGPRIGPRAHGAQVAARLRLGQRHRRQPLAADETRQDTRLERLVRVRLQRLAGAVQQPGVHGPGVVGRHQHLEQRGVEQLRQPLPAPRRVAGQRR